MLVFNLMFVSCKNEPNDDTKQNEDTIKTLDGTWVSNWGGKLIFNNNNWEYSEKTPTYKGTFTINNNLLTQKVTHIYSGNEYLLYYVNLYGLEIEANKWYSVTEAKAIVGDDLFNYIASENDLDPVTLSMDPVPFSVDGNTLYFGVAIYSRQLSLNKIELFMNKFTNEEGPASNWACHPTIYLSDLISRPIKKYDSYILNISGTVDKNLENFRCAIWQGDWEWLGDGIESYNITNGFFNLTFECNIWLDFDIKKRLFLSIGSNHSVPPENYYQFTLMATINDVSISFVEK